MMKVAPLRQLLSRPFRYFIIARKASQRSNIRRSMPEFQMGTIETFMENVSQQTERDCEVNSRYLCRTNILMSATPMRHNGRKLYDSIVDTRYMSGSLEIFWRNCYFLINLRKRSGTLSYPSSLNEAIVSFTLESRNVWRVRNGFLNPMARGSGRAWSRFENHFVAANEVGTTWIGRRHRQW